MKSKVSDSKKPDSVETKVKEKKRKVIDNVKEKSVNETVESIETVTHKKKKKFKRNPSPSQNGLDEGSEKLNGNKESDSDNTLQKVADSDNENNNEDEPTARLSSKEMQQISGKSLREGFKSSNGLDTLKKFLRACNEAKNRDIVAEYLDSGGNILEILKLLSEVDKKNIGNATTVFSAVTTLLMKIMASYPQYQSSAEQACRHLINTHLPLVHSMISSQSNAKQRKVVLRLLSAIVSLSSNLARELLAHLSIQSPTLEFLVRHTKPTDSQSVRTCFIHFLLAFLVEGNVPVIRALLEKRGLLSSIFPDLMYDSKEVIHLVLSTIKTYILENSGISKTVKLHVFSTSVIQNLVRLYNWKGPNNFKKNKNQEIIVAKAYLEEKEAVTDILQSFLITLLTSHKYGVIFHDYSFGGMHNKHNQLVHTVLQSLDRPWEYEKVSQLVIKILVACPDLITSQFRLLEPYLEPRLSKKWIALMEFVRKVIESLDLETCIKNGYSVLSLSALSNIFTSVIMPGTIIKNGIMPALLHTELAVRHTGITVLLTMFEHIKKAILIAQTIYSKDTADDTFRSRTTEYILKTAPKLDATLNVWNAAFESWNAAEMNKEVTGDSNFAEPLKYEHLNTILNLLHIYSTICPDLSDSPAEFEPTKFLTMLSSLGDIAISELNTIKVKAIRFLISLDSTAFAPNKKVFGEALTFLVSILNDESFTTLSHAKEILRTLLNITGMFELCSDQLDIWIHGLMSLKDTESRLDMARYLNNAIKKVAQNPEKYLNMIIEAEEAVSGTVVYTADIEDIFIDLQRETDTDNYKSDNGVRMLRNTSISPLLCYLLRKMESKTTPAISSYMSYVLVHTLHYQVSPKCLLHLVSDTPELYVRKYLSSWSASGKPVLLKMSDSSMAAACTLSSMLLGDTKIHLNELFQGTTEITFKYHDEDITIAHSMSEYEVLSLVKMTVFYLTRFTEWGTLSETQSESCRRILISCLYIANQITGQSLVYECAKSIFCHPIVVTCFFPFSYKQKDTMKRLITYLIYEVSNATVHLSDANNPQGLFSYLRKKMLSQLFDMIDKNKRADKVEHSEMVTSLMSLMQLTPHDIISVLHDVSEMESKMLINKEKSDLSVYGHILPVMLRLACSKPVKSERLVFEILFELNPEFVRHIWNHMLYIKTRTVSNIDKWELALIEYFKNNLHTIVEINSADFSALLKTEILPSTIKLISFVLDKKTVFIPLFTNYIAVSQTLIDGSIFFPIFGCNLTYKWKENILQKLYKDYRDEIVLYLSDPKSSNVWIENNTDAVSSFMQQTFVLSDCEEVSNIILQIGDKLEMVSIHYIHLVQAMYKKYIALKDGDEEPIINLIKLLLHVLTLTLKKESKNGEKLRVLCDAVNDAIKKLIERRSDNYLAELSSSHSWSQFTRFSLKMGLKVPKDDKYVSIMKTLNRLCDIAYKDNANEEYVKLLFEMTTSHSEFINIMLGSTIVKRDLIEFLWILVRKNKAVMMPTHVPLYLSAYNATISETDQLLLLLLQYYESNNIALNEYRPYLWGNAAAVHYSVRGEADTALWRQPSTTQVLNLFEKDMINNTIRNYPVHRGLRNDQEKNFEEESHIYDPAFYLPLLCFLLSENNVISCHKMAQSGALALAFASCGSSQTDTRIAAYTIISRYYSHLEASRPKANLLWMRLIDSLRYGIASLESPLSDVQLSCIVSTFLAQASLVATQPLNQLYSRLQTFLMAKPALDLKTIPELLQLLHSSDVEHKAHRHWILEVIRDGIRTESDAEIAFKCLLFKVLFGFYTCSLSDNRTKKLILEVIYATTKLPKAAAVLVNGYSLLPWLSVVAKSLHSDDTQQITTLLKITDALSDIILNSKGENGNIKCMFLHTVLSLQTSLSKDIGITAVLLYLKVLEKLLGQKDVAIDASAKQVECVVDFCKVVLGDVDECEDMLHHGCRYVKLTDCSNEASEVEVAKHTLKRTIYSWVSSRERNNLLMDVKRRV